MVTNVYFPVLGGISTYLGNLRRGLRRLDVDVHVISYPAWLARREMGLPRLVRGLVHAGFIALTVPRVLVLDLFSRRLVVHSHGANFAEAVGALAGYFGIPAMHTFHSPPPARSSHWVERLREHLDLLAFVSIPTRDLYSRNVRRSWVVPTVIAPGAVDGAVFRPLAPDEREARHRALLPLTGGRTGDPLILFIGRLNPDKGVRELVIAFTAVSAAAPRARLVLVGPTPRQGPDRRYLHAVRSALAPTLRDRVVFLHDLSASQVTSLHAIATVFVCPSLWQEPSPMVVVEAMSSGVPVVASAVGGLPLRVVDGETGIIVPPGDVDALATALTGLVTDGESRARLAAAARTRAVTEYGLERLAARHLDWYRRLIQGRRIPDDLVEVFFDGTGDGRPGG